MASDLKNSAYSQHQYSFGVPDRKPSVVRLPKSLKGLNCENLLKGLLSGTDASSQINTPSQKRLGLAQDKKEPFYLTVLDPSNKSLSVNAELKQHLKNHPSRRKLNKKNAGLENIGGNVQSIQRFNQIDLEEQNLMREQSNQNLLKLATPVGHYGQEQPEDVFMKPQLVYIFTDGQIIGKDTPCFRLDLAELLKKYYFLNMEAVMEEMQRNQNDKAKLAEIQIKFY